MPRPYDVIIFGATGFTGKLVAKYVQQNCTFRWAIAGRSTEKLQQLRDELVRLGGDGPSIMTADVEQAPASLAIFKEATLVLNCTGPYRFFGKPIVQACIEHSTHYMDITGEPQFMETTFLEQHEAAQRSGSIVIHSCAFDSVPADLGNLFVNRQFAPGCCSAIESFLELVHPKGLAGHFTTYECAVHGVADADALRQTRKRIESAMKPPRISSPGPRIQRQTGFFFDPRMQKHSLPFMGADASVVRASQRSLALTRALTVWPQYAAYAAVPSLGARISMTLYGALFVVLASFRFGREVLLAHPEFFTGGVFSHKGPSKEQLEATSFKMHFFARGFQSAASASVGRVDKTLRAVVAGPEPGYVATPIIFVRLAECLLAEHASMPPGVHTPAAAFYDSPSVFDRLTSAGIVIKVVD